MRHSLRNLRNPYLPLGFSATRPYILSLIQNRLSYRFQLEFRDGAITASESPPGINGASSLVTMECGNWHKSPHSFVLIPSQFAAPTPEIRHNLVIVRTFLGPPDV